MSLRKILIGVALAVALLLGAGIVLFLRIDPKDYVELVNAEVKAATGRELKIDGKVGYSLSLLPTVAAEGVGFQNAVWGSRPDMMTAKRIEIQIALLPLIRGKIEVHGLTLVEPDVLLEVDPQGATNWTFQRERTQPAAPDASSPPPIEIRRARIEKGSLSYRAAQAEQALHLSLGQLTLASAGERLELKAEGSLNTVPIELTATVEHSGRLGARGATGKGDIRLSGPGLKLAALGMLPLAAGGLEVLDVKLDAEVGDWSALAKLTQAELPQWPALKLDGRARIKADTLTFDELHARLGKSSATGSLRIGLDEQRRDLQARVDAPLVDLAELLGPPGPPASLGSPGTQKQRPDGRLFSAEPFALEALRALAGELELRIAKLALRDGKTVDGVQAHARFERGKIAADPVAIAVEGKPLRMRVNADASSGKSLALDLAIDGQGISLGALGALLNVTGTPEGSPTDIAVRFSGTGASMRALMAGANADLRIVIGPGRIRNRILALGADITELLNAVNPARARDPYTELKCAVIRLPIRQGVARVDNSIAAETGKVNVIVAGVIDLRNETLDLGIRPKAATGLGIDLSGLARLGRLRGSLSDPKVELDFSGTAQAATKLGLATAVGGLSSLLAGGLLTDRVPEQACRAALAGTARAGAKPAAKEQPLGGLFGGFKQLIER